MYRVVATDGFYRDPHAIRRKALGLKYVEPEEITGWRTERGYLPRNIEEIIEKATGWQVRDLHKPEGTHHDNGVFYASFSDGERKEKPGVHYDEPLSHVVGIVYLTESVPADCGVSFYRHKRTGLEYAPTQGDASRLGTSRSALREILERDSCYRSRWVEIDRIGYKFNRAVFFPAKRLHAATRHFGGDLKTGRIYQLFTLRGN